MGIAWVRDRIVGAAADVFTSHPRWGEIRGLRVAVRKMEIDGISIVWWIDYLPGRNGKRFEPEPHLGNDFRVFENIVRPVLGAVASKASAITSVQIIARMGAQSEREWQVLCDTDGKFGIFVFVVRVDGTFTRLPENHSARKLVQAVVTKARPLRMDRQGVRHWANCDAAGGAQKDADPFAPFKGERCRVCMNPPGQEEED